MSFVELNGIPVVSTLWLINRVPSNRLRPLWVQNHRNPLESRKMRFTAPTPSPSADVYDLMGRCSAHAVTRTTEAIDTSLAPASLRLGRNRLNPSSAVK